MGVVAVIYLIVMDFYWALNKTPNRFTFVIAPDRHAADLKAQKWFERVMGYPYSWKNNGADYYCDLRIIPAPLDWIKAWLNRNLSWHANRNEELLP